MAAKIVTPKDTGLESVDTRIAELEAAKGVINHLKQTPDKAAQERILNLAGDILGCWTKRVRRTKAEVAAAAGNGGTVEAPAPAPV